MLGRHENMRPELHLHTSGSQFQSLQVLWSGPIWRGRHAYHAKSDHSRALEDFETVIQTCGDEAPGAYFHAAQALFPLDRADDACTYLRTAAREANNKELSREVGKWLTKECGE